MTFMEFLNESVDLCRSAFDDKQLCSDEQKIGEKIKSIAQIMNEKTEQIEDEIDIKTRLLLQDVIETGIGIPGIGYVSLEEMVSKLSHIKATYVLNNELMKYEKELTVFSYEYAAGQSRFRNYERACEGVLYVLESKNAKRENAIIFTKDAVVFVKINNSEVFMISNKVKMRYENIIGVCQGIHSGINEEYIDIIEGTFDDVLTWRLHTIKLGSIDSKIICNVIDEIIRSIHSLQSEKSVVEYYSNACRLEYEIPFHLRQFSLAEQWEIVTILGEKAHFLDKECCKDILLTIYERQKNRAMIDGNKKKENLSRSRILALTEPLGNQERIRAEINCKRQFTIPEKFYETMKFKDEVELIYEDGKLFITPGVADKKNALSENLPKKVTGDASKKNSLVESVDKDGENENSIENNEKDTISNEELVAMNAEAVKKYKSIKKKRNKAKKEGNEINIISDKI